MFKKFISLVIALCLIISMSNIVFGADIEMGLKAYFAFDEGAGSEVFDNVNNSQFNISGNPQWVEGKSGSALRFSKDTTEHICLGVGSVASLAEGSNALTVSAWVNLNEVPSTGTYRILTSMITAATVGFELYLSSGALRTAARSIGSDAWSSINTSLNDSYTQRWIHIAAVADYKEKTLKLYVDGELKAQNNAIPFASDTFTSSNLTGIDTIGGNGRDANTFNGVIDDVRIYNRALSATDIQLFLKEGIVVGDIAYFDSQGNEITELQQGEIICEVPIINVGQTEYPAVVILSLHKKSVHTMQDVVISRYVAMSQSSDTIQTRITVPHMPEAYYVQAMVWDGLKLMQHIDSSQLN